jgi:chitin disaccharide deacetylase
VVRVVARGDDAGACVAANRAVEQAAREGVLRNASVLACGPALQDASERLSHIPGLCIGLHLALASEWDRLTWAPLSRHPLLTDARGCLPQSPALLPRTDAAIEAMLLEADAQLAALRAAGLEPVYIDEHMGTSAWAVPELKAPLSAWAHERGLPWPHLYGVPGDGPLTERLKTCPEGDYLWVNHPSFPEDDALLMGNADYPLEEILTERDADRRLWLELSPTERVHFVSWAEI